MNGAPNDAPDGSQVDSHSGTKSPISVSVIIPVFNDQAGIDACLKALQQQAHPQSQLEVIVVDNASTLPIQLDPVHANLARLIVCTTPGSYAARNAGLEIAKGEILAFTDADCRPDQNWISSGVAALRSCNMSCIIGGDVRMQLSSRPTAVELYQALTGFMQRDNINTRGFTVTANLFAIRTQMVDIGPFDETLLSGGDLEWSWRAAAAGYPVQFAADAIVVTTPRVSIRSAIRQARRVAGGRYALRHGAAKHVNSARIRPHRNAWQATSWILLHPELSLWNRLRVFCVSSILYLAQIVETCRLAVGREPERR